MAASKTNPLLASRRVKVLLVALLAACASKAGSGSDGTASPTSPHPDDYPGVTNGQTYEKNPDVKLPREYWIILATKDGARFILPRTDGSRHIVEECQNKGPLAPLFEDAQLCTSATGPGPQLTRVNTLTASEARQVSTFLHERLRFECGGSAASTIDPPDVRPRALTSDLLDVCQTFPADREGVMRTICDRLLQTKMSSSGAPWPEGHVLTLDECRVMAARLNELYGIR